MKDLLTLTVLDTMKPGVITLVCPTTMKMKVLATNNVAKLTCNVIESLMNGTHRYRPIQKSYDAGTLRMYFMEDLSNVKSNMLSLMLKYKQTYWTETLEKQGYRAISSYNALRLIVSTKLIQGEAPQVLLRTGRYRTLYVQRGFNSIWEAQAYVDSTPVEQVLLDTDGVDVPFMHKVRKSEARKWEPKVLRGVAGRPKGAKTRRRRKRWIHPLLR